MKEKKLKKKPPHGQTVGEHPKAKVMSKEARIGSGAGSFLGAWTWAPKPGKTFARSLGRNFAASAIGGGLGYAAGGLIGAGVHKIREHQEHLKKKKRLRDFIPVRRANH